jgi:hypothetical protein
MAENVNWEAEAEMDPTIRTMLRAGVPMTRENYLNAAFGTEIPDPLEERASRRRSDGSWR